MSFFETQCSSLYDTLHTHLAYLVIQNFRKVLLYVGKRKHWSRPIFLHLVIACTPPAYTSTSRKHVPAMKQTHWPRPPTMEVCVFSLPHFSARVRYHCQRVSPALNSSVCIYMDLEVTHLFLWCTCKCPTSAFFTVRLHVMQRTVLLLQFCLSVCHTRGLWRK